MGSESMNGEENLCGKLVTANVEVLGPATPDENGEHSHECSNFSPTPNYETPKETLFDSFAPASDKLLLQAPLHRKYRQESINPVVRRLDFTASAPPPVDEEKRLFEIVYSTIMDAILAEAESADAVTVTPPRISSFAETCPAAPIKLARKQRCIDKEICKKLEF